MPVDSEVLVVTSLISRICQLSLSKVLIEIVMCACIPRNKRACVRNVFLKNIITEGCASTEVN